MLHLLPLRLIYPEFDDFFYQPQRYWIADGKLDRTFSKLVLSQLAFEFLDTRWGWIEADVVLKCCEMY